MSEFHNEKLRILANKCNAEMMTPVDAFVQGFIMGRKYQREFTTQLHNNILREMHENSDYKFDLDNWWDNKIAELEKALVVARGAMAYAYEDYADRFYLNVKEDITVALQKLKEFKG